MNNSEVLMEMDKRRQPPSSALSSVRGIARDFSLRLDFSAPSTAAATSLPRDLAPTSELRRAQSIVEADTPVHRLSQASTVLYLAYGSNLCDETFQGQRRIKPLSAVNVQVPELRLTFDLPGVPYMEPCFANTSQRPIPGAEAEAEAEAEATRWSTRKEKTTLDPLFKDDHHKDVWDKGLVGTVYEVTKEDFARIIASEGGGSAYQDVQIDCYMLDTDISKPVPAWPEGTSFKAHTLFAPVQQSRTRRGRKDPSYAQPSPRYLKLINDGAKQRGLPLEYQTFLANIQPYSPVAFRQRLGTVVFPAIWAPLIMSFFALSSIFKDETGFSPPWVACVTNGLFGIMWKSYDSIFRHIFGDGERGEAPDDEQDADYEHISLSGSMMKV